MSALSRIRKSIAFASAVGIIGLSAAHASSFLSADDSSFAPTGNMSTGRLDHTATLLPGGKVLIAGGTTVLDGTSVASAEVYDPVSGTFSATGSMGTARSWHTATLLPSGKVLIAGGQSGSHDNAGSISSAELYDPVTGAFSQTGGMSTGRWLFTATLLPDGKVLVAGGQATSSVPVPDAELYDPATGTFSATGPMSTARTAHTSTLLADGRVLVTGGSDYFGQFSSAELYDPVAGTFSATGSMSSPREAHTATLLPDTKVLLVGGLDGVGVSATAELYDPSTGTFSDTGAMATDRYGYTATLLGNGQVLVAGGSFNSSAEVYDPISGTFSDAGAMSIGRWRHTATLLQNGTLLLAGGSDASGVDLYGLFEAAPTPAGTNVVVRPPSVTGTTPLTLTFDSVTEAGETILAPPAGGPNVPPTFALGDPPLFYDISTTAQFSGTISVCVDFSGISFPAGSELRLLHYENGTWQDVTTSGPTGTVICGTVTSLSPFAVVRVQRMICPLYDQAKAYKTGSTAPIKLKLCSPSGANLSSASIPLIATGVYLVSTNAPGPLADSGNANPDYQFRFAGDSYIFNLSLKGFPRGTYALTSRPADDSTTFTVQFQVK